jgi:hypothetical protein
MQPLGELWTQIIKSIQKTIFTQPWKEEHWKRNQYERDILIALALINNMDLVFQTPSPPKVLAPSSLSPPSQGFIKHNFDGAYKGNLGQASLGGFFHKNVEGIIRTYVSKLVHTTNNAMNFLSLEK